MALSEMETFCEWLETTTVFAHSPVSQPFGLGWSPGLVYQAAPAPEATWWLVPANDPVVHTSPTS